MKGEVMYVFTDCHISAQALQALRAHGHFPIPCMAHPALDPAIASHPDMLLFPCENGIFVLGGHKLDTDDVPQLPIKQAPARKYPHDVLLNAARIGHYLVCRPDSTAAELLQYAKEAGLTVLPVRQGYAKCNLCVVSDHAAMTEDASIAAALRSAGMDVLQIDAGGVALPGYPYGFIGGASGSDGTHVFFYGDLSLHRYGERIATFCQKHGRIPVSLASHQLTDVGSLLFYDKK
jgi:hypothetical protein